MNVMNWLFVFIASLLGIGAIGYLYNRSSQRRSSLWNMLSLAFASLICATMFATLFVYSPTVNSAVQAAAAQSFTCVGAPALVRAGDAVAITGVAAADSEVTIVQGETTLATATADNGGAFEASITLSTPGLQNVTCQSDANVVTLSFLVIGQAAPAATATNTAEPTATNTPAPTATNTTEATATATEAPAAVAPEIDLASIPEQIMPGDTFRLRGTTGASARVRVTINGKVVAGAVAGPNGNWRASIGFAAAGTYTLTAQLVENDNAVAESEPVLIDVIAPEPTATNTAEPTATNTPEPTATNTPEPTATNTPEPTATNTTEPTATNTPEPTATNTPEPTATNTPEPTATNTTEPTATNTPEPTATNTPEPTATNTPEPTATNTPEPTATNTPEPTATNTPEPVAPVVDTASIPEQILPGDTFRLRGTAAGGAKVHVAVNDKVVASAVAGPNGSWRTTVGFAAAGTYTVTTQLMDNDTVVATSDPILVEVVAPEATPTNTPEPTATTAAVEATATVSDTTMVSDTATVSGTTMVSDTATVSGTTSVWVDNSQAVSETVPAVDASQPVSDTVAAPDALPGTGSDFSQGVPWVILILVFGALLTLGIGRLSQKPTA